MGKGKSALLIKTKKELRKTHLRPEEKIKSRATKKSNSNNKKESTTDCDVDSLEFLKETTKRKKFNDIDEKIDLLKNELKTLFSDKLLDKNQDDSIDQIIDPENTNTQNSNVNQEKTAILGSEHKLQIYDDLNYKHIKKQNFTPVFSSTPSKFPELQDKTIKENIVQTDDGKCLPQNSKFQAGDISENSVIIINESESNTSSLYSISQQKLEELLYKSFVLQNSELNLSESKESSSNEKRSTRKITKGKNPSIKNLTRSCNKEKFIQKNLKKCFRFSKRYKRRRIIKSDSSQSDVEVIDLENSSSCNEKAKDESVCIDLEMKDYDWNEPFDLDETEFNSEEKIIKDDKNKNTQVNKEPKLNVTETNLSSCSIESSKDQIKRAWECPVCFEQFKGQQVAATQCGHTFCKKCLESHFSKLGKDCPSCRFNLSLDKPFITLFNF